MNDNYNTRYVYSFTQSPKAEKDENVRKAILDENISRLEKWITDNEMAVVSACRLGLMDIHSLDKTLVDKEVLTGDRDALPDDSRYTQEEIKVRNSNLKRYLLYENYGVTMLTGACDKQNDNCSCGQELFLVVNLDRDANFRKDMFEISEWFNQDHFLYKPQGSDDARLINTNDRDGYGKETEVGLFRDNIKAEDILMVGTVGFVCVYDRAAAQEENAAEKALPSTFRIPKLAVYRLICRELLGRVPSERVVSSCIMRKLIQDGLLPEKKKE